MLRFFALFLVSFIANRLALAQAPWEAATYPDEAGFQRRTAGMLHRIAAQGFGERSQAPSVCPDTGLPVHTYALAGEEVVSPYTGRRYRQGDTGYFGPKQRDSLGRIVAFGGDPLKYDLPPATAALLLMATPDKARAFLSIPGNLNQQYHFAATHWARFYPLLAPQMSQAWQTAFWEAVGSYSENRRPSDGGREHASALSSPHNLVGEPGKFIGGNAKDGGTENHKLMWRTSALLYAQLCPGTARISGHSPAEAEKLVKKMLRDFLKQLLRTGNGEYDSSIYYPHAIAGWLNLYDFSPDPETRLLAKVALDYALATYGLKVINGSLAGAQKRGYPNGEMNEMERYLWAWTGDHTHPVDLAQFTTSIQQATTRYRPNQLVFNLLTKNIPLPFEAQMARPSYHCDEPNVFQETFYGSSHFGLGSVALGMVDNPGQQIVWSLVAKGATGNFVFSGGQPRYGQPGGHSPYTQTLQKRGTLIVMTGPNASPSPASPTREQQHRADTTRIPLVVPGPPAGQSPAALADYVHQARHHAATWLFVPKNVDQIREQAGRVFIQAGETLVAVLPFGASQKAAPFFWLDAKAAEVKPTDRPADPAQRVLNAYKILVIPGQISGYVLEVSEKSTHGTLDAFIAQIQQKAKLTTDELVKQQKIGYTSLLGDRLVMQYHPAGLKAGGEINGQAINYAAWAGGMAYQSPFVKVGQGKMTLSDGKTQYSVWFEGDVLRFGQE